MILHRTFARLEAGEIPVSWFETLVRRTRRLTPDQAAQVDERVSGWDLANISSDRFERSLGQLIAWFGPDAEKGTPAARRAVHLEASPDADGTACLTVTGPVHELLALTRRLDLAAREVQRRQRRALAERTADVVPEIPFDLDGDVARSGQVMSRAQIRYAILTGTVLETPGIEVPESRFRLQVLVPALTLLGESDAPGTLDGTIPLPAPMARHLAAGEPTWYRILTDPSSGEYLPLPPTRYTATRSMAEHLRLLDPVCALPGCAQNVCTTGEMDHIEEFDHHHPERGGRTAFENLHRLCPAHHDMKTRGLIDPVRGPDGRTLWHLDGRGEVLGEIENRDLLTPELADALDRSWEAYLEAEAWARRHRGDSLEATEACAVTTPSAASTPSAATASPAASRPSPVPVSAAAEPPPF